MSAFGGKADSGGGRFRMSAYDPHFRHQPPSDAILASVSWKPHCQMFQSELPKHPGTPARRYPTVDWGYSWGRVPCVVGVTEVGRGFVRDVAGCCRPSPSAC